MNLLAIWKFIAGDSRRAPIAVALAIAVAYLLLRTQASSAVVATSFSVIIALGLATSIFERT